MIGRRFRARIRTPRAFLPLVVHFRVRTIKIAKVSLKIAFFAFFKILRIFVYKPSFFIRFQEFVVLCVCMCLCVRVCVRACIYVLACKMLARVW